MQGPFVGGGGGADFFQTLSTYGSYDIRLEE